MLQLRPGVKACTYLVADPPSAAPSSFICHSLGFSFTTSFREIVLWSIHSNAFPISVALTTTHRNNSPTFSFFGLLATGISFSLGIFGQLLWLYESLMHKLKRSVYLLTKRNHVGTTIASEYTLVSMATGLRSLLDIAFDTTHHSLVTCSSLSSNAL